jgi:hypothetical protein
LKNYLNYYQHYCNAHQHWKFKMLRSAYGWEGEGRFWALNNLIGSADNCTLDLNKKAVRISVADELDYSVDEFMKYLEFLSLECELIIFLDNKLTTEIVRDNLKEVMKQRTRMKETRNKQLGKKLANEKDLFPKLLNNLAN